MRVSELVPRVKNKRFFLPFLTLGTSTKLLGFMRFSAILDPLEISSRGCTPGKPVRGRTGQAALSPSARAEGPGKPAARTCVSVLHRRERQLAAPRRDLTAEALRADARDRLDQARHKPPPQGANRQRRHSDGAWPHGPSRGTRALARGQLSRRHLACAGGAVCCGKEARKVPAKLAARTRASESIKRERQLAAPRRELASPATDRRDSGGTPQRRECECLRKEYPGGGW